MVWFTYIVIEKNHMSNNTLASSFRAAPEGLRQLILADSIC